MNLSTLSGFCGVSSLWILHSALVVWWLGSAAWGEEKAVRELRYSETRYGRSLDAATSGLELVAPANCCTRPFTLQARIRIEPRSFRFRNLIAAVGDASGQPIWQLYAEARAGLSFEGRGLEPAVTGTPDSISDGDWHDIAVQCDDDRIRIFVDGDQVADAPVRGKFATQSAKQIWIGQSIDGKRGLDGWLDDIHLVSGTPPIRNSWKAGTKTLLMLDFEESDSDYLRQWTPVRSTRPDAEPWERETDDDWMDERFQKMDKGPAFACSTRLPDRWAGPRNLTVTLDGPNRHLLVFDTEHCVTTATYRDAEIRISPRRFGILDMPEVHGSELAYVDARHGWKAGNKPAETHFEGFHRIGREIVLTYDVAGTDVLEQPSLLGLTETTMLVVRRLDIGITRPVQQELVLAVAERSSGQWQRLDDGRIEMRDGDDLLQLELVVTEGDALLEVQGRRVQIRFARGRNRVGLLLHRGRASVPRNALTIPAIDRARLRSGGPPVWPETIELSGKLATNDSAYVVDTIPVPDRNPWNALMYLSGFDFTDQPGQAAICTVHGDVWLVDGLDQDLHKVRWKRFAAGLYQPLGLKFVRGRVYVLGRDQITRLHDMNDDGEADHYECFNNELVINGTPHAYASCLETDPDGWFYFFKCGRNPPHGGKMLRVSPDGSRLEVFASGYRHPIGLGISPKGVVTAADNQGNWIPASSIQRVERGSFHGYMPEVHQPGNTRRFDPPLVWLPMTMDNSSGGQTWVTSDSWGPLRDRMLHVSWGRCSLMTVLEQRVGEIHQAAVVAFPGIRFLSGPIRPRFSPHDGQLYVCGLDGWQTAAVRDGCFQRVRYTKRSHLMPIHFSVHANGLLLKFSEELDPAVCLPRNFSVARWQYRWTEDYGSPEYSVTDPNRIGHDSLAVERVSLSEGGRTLFLKVPGLGPAMQMQLKMKLAGVGGIEQDVEVLHTVYALADEYPDR